MEATMAIAALADAGGVGVETVRYYQRRGLLPEPPRPQAGIRRYGTADLRRLRFIRSAQAAGFSLAEIGELLALDAGHDHARARELARGRIAALDARIAELEQARAALERLARACSRSGRAPCPILTAFDTVATRPFANSTSWRRPTTPPLVDSDRRPRPPPRARLVARRRPAPHTGTQ